MREGGREEKEGQEKERKSRRSVGVTIAILPARKGSMVCTHEGFPPRHHVSPLPLFPFCEFQLLVRMCLLFFGLLGPCPPCLEAMASSPSIRTRSR